MKIKYINKLNSYVNITINNTYSVIKEDKNNYFIQNDIGEIHKYKKGCFKILENSINHNENYCKKCKFNNRNKNIFPCNNCDKQGNHPITCYDCRYYPCGNKKGVRTCNKFKWW